VALDTFPSAPLEADELADTLAISWGLVPDNITYCPKGAGSYHWLGEVAGAPTLLITVDDLDTKPWIGASRDATGKGLAAAYETARVLHEESGLAFVVAPLRNANGSMTVRLSDQYTVAVFPFVEGRVGSWGDPLTNPGRDALLQELARLHKAILPTSVRIDRRPLDLPERHFLTAALGVLDRPWTGGALSEPARHVLAAHSQNVRDWLGQLDDLARRAVQLEERVVITHGEPHPGNVIHCADGLRLLDWDTVALGRPERDLWMLDDGSPGGFALYEDLTGTSISETAIRFYRLAWALSDIASFADMFRSAHQDTQWIRQKWGAFQQLLGGAPSAPYARSRHPWASDPATGTSPSTHPSG
jgi:spectinomycin phosphotransferase